MGTKIGKDGKLLILLMVSLIIVGLIILSNFLSFSKFQEVLVDQLRDQQLTETEHVAGRMEIHILQAKDELVTLSKFPEIEDIDASRCAGGPQEDGEDQGFISDTMLKTDEDGNVVACSSSRFSNFLGLNIKNKDYFSVPQETREPYITGIVRQGESSLIIVSVPLFKTIAYTPYPNFLGDFKGVLLTIIEIDNLFNIYLHPYIQQGRNEFLLANIENDETLLRSQGIEDYATVKANLPTGRGLDTITDFNGLGESIITAADMLLGTERFRLIVLTPLASASADLPSVQKRHLISLIFIIVVSLTANVFFLSLYRSRQRVQTRLEHAEVTLKKMGISVEIEQGRYDASDIRLEPKKVYLIKEDDENHAHELFIGCLNEGFAGLGIVREDPTELKKRYNLKKTSFIWMTKGKAEGMPAETDIDRLYRLILQFIEESPKSVVLIDRLDYIFQENTSETVIKRIHDLKDLTSGSESIIIFSVEPGILDTAQMKAIEAETVDIYGKHLDQRSDLSKLETDILYHINEGNTSNRLVSYKDITQKLSITKPTTRVKISKLQHLGLVQVEQRGRFKSLKITSAGRRILG